jgi:FAD/FMN-containing dehydrogenase
MWVVDKEDAMYDRATIDALKTGLRGALLQPDDADYEAARKVYNGMIDRRPRCIVRCSNVADVITAVRFPGKHQLLVAVRGGGHNGAGLGTCDDGLVIDLSRLKGIRVDPIVRTAQVEGGCPWGDVDHATHAFGPPALDLVSPQPYPVLQGMFDALYPPGLQWYWRADFVKELSDDAMARHVPYGAQIPTLHSTMHLYPINGAAHRPGPQDTAFSYRDATWAEVIVGVDPDPANNARITDWTRGYWGALHPYSAGGAYVNFLMEEGQERIRATYRDNYHRLVVIKNTYDPMNFLRVNQNITPTV